MESPKSRTWFVPKVWPARRAVCALRPSPGVQTTKLPEEPCREIIHAMIELPTPARTLRLAIVNCTQGTYAEA